MECCFYQKQFVKVPFNVYDPIYKLREFLVLKCKCQQIVHKLATWYILSAHYIRDCVNPNFNGKHFTFTPKVRIRRWMPESVNSWTAASFSVLSKNNRQSFLTLSHFVYNFSKKTWIFRSDFKSVQTPIPHLYPLVTRCFKFCHCVALIYNLLRVKKREII